MTKRLILSVLLCSFLSLFLSCRPSGADISIETIVVTNIETVVETVEVEKRSPYTYELLKEMSEVDNYIGGPASGHKVAFASIDGSIPYARLVQESIAVEWISAGGTEDTILLLDNMADREKALVNAEAAFGWGAEVFIQFFTDVKTNALIGKEASGNGIYMVAVEVPVPGFPLMGVDNYGAGVLAGKWAADMVNTLYGGWDNVDRVVYLGPGDLDSKAALRIYGSKVEMVDSFGNGADYEIEGSKAVIVKGVFIAGDGGRAISHILKSNPEDRNIIVFCLNDSAAEGVYKAALEQGRWDQDKWLVVSQGLDDRGKVLVTDEVINADIAFFPEKYGKYLRPAALAHIHGNPVPPYIFMENAVITAGNIGEYYP
jgi:ribose transport system substrate-binding protein